MHVAVQSPSRVSSLRPHGLQHARPPCPSPSPEVSPSSCPLHWWCHLAHLIFCGPRLLLPSIFPSIRDFQMSRLLPSGNQNTGASASVLPKNIQGWFPLGLTCLISLQSKGLASLLQHHSSKASILHHSAFFIVQLSHLYMTTGKTLALTRRTFVGKVMSLLLNMLSRLVITFLSRSVF